MIAKGGLLAVLIGGAAWAQTSEKVFYFTYVASRQDLQAVTNMIRATGDIRDAVMDTQKRAMTVTGSAEQIALAGWLASEMDTPNNSPGTRNMPFSDPRASLAQIYYLSHMDNPQELQDIVNMVRSVSEIQRCFPMFQQKAIVMRAMPDQIKASDWILSVADQPGGSGSIDYQLAPADWNVGRTLAIQAVHLAYLSSPHDILDLVNLARSLAKIQRFFPVYGRRMLVMRGDADQVALANWAVKQLDGPPGQGIKDYQIGGPDNQAALLAYVNSSTAASLQETVNLVRTQAGTPYTFPFPAQKALAVRGTPDQLAIAKTVIQSRYGK